MKQAGFSLIEMITVLLIMGTLIGIAAFQYNGYSRKTNIDRQTRQVYADILNSRAEALLQKVPRSVKVVSATNISVYPTIDATGTATVGDVLKYVVSSDLPSGGFVSFDTRGIATIYSAPGTVAGTQTMTICIDPPGNPATVDSILITKTMIQAGKRNGSACNSGNFTAR